VYRTRGISRRWQDQAAFGHLRMPVDLRIDTEGNPELKTIDVIRHGSGFTVETFGRPKPGVNQIGSQIISFWKGSTPLACRVSHCARRKILAEQGRFTMQWTQYSGRLCDSAERPRRIVRHGRGVSFYQKNLSGAPANAFGSVQNVERRKNGRKSGATSTSERFLHAGHASAPSRI